MNRRGFLKALGVGAVGVVATPAILEALAPTRSIFLPPRGGWFRMDGPHPEGGYRYAGFIHENVVQANAGVPSFLTNYFDPKLLEILLEPERFVGLQGALEWLDG